MVGLRLDAFLSAQLNEISRNRIKKLIEDGCVKINERKCTKASRQLKISDEIQIEIPKPKPYKLKGEKIPMDIVFEDSHLLVINKPPNLVVHPGAGHWNGTLVNALLHHCKNLSGIGGVQRPGIVHRLDKDTSGLIVVAKEDISHDALSRQFKERSIQRSYIAMVVGKLKKQSGSFDAPIGRSRKHRKKISSHTPKGRTALTHYKVLEQYNDFTLVEARLATGRTHQIRVHFSEAGYPVVGDPVYGTKRYLQRIKSVELKEVLQTINRQMLHAATLGFIHPITLKKLFFEIPIPRDFQDLVKLLKKYTNN